MRSHSTSLAAFVAATLAACKHRLCAAPKLPCGVARTPAAENPVAVLAIDALAADLKIPRERNHGRHDPRSRLARQQHRLPATRPRLPAGDHARAQDHAAGEGQITSSTRPRAAHSSAARPRSLAASRKSASWFSARRCWPPSRTWQNGSACPRKTFVPVSSEEMTWDDASLGCPEPGVSTHRWKRAAGC